MDSNSIRSKTGRPLGELTLESILSGELATEDLSISADTLKRGADEVDSAGYEQYAQNLRRAAELTELSNQEIIEIYRALRPGRATRAELLAIANRLERDVAAPLTAELIREAAEIYRERGLVE